MSLFGVFWSVFSRIRAEYGGFHSNSLYSVQMQENVNQKNSEYEHTFYAVFLGHTYRAKNFLVN